MERDDRTFKKNRFSAPQTQHGKTEPSLKTHDRKLLIKSTFFDLVHFWCIFTPQL